jgi:thioredoxin 2
VQGIPTLLLLERGRVIARQTGAAPEPALRTWIEQGLRSRDADAGVGTPGPG